MSNLRWQIVGFWLRGRKGLEPPEGKNLLYPRKCSILFEEVRGRHPTCAKIDTTTVRNVPLDTKEVTDLDLIDLRNSVRITNHEMHSPVEFWGICSSILPEIG